MRECFREEQEPDELLGPLIYEDVPGPPQRLLRLKRIKTTLTSGEETSTLDRAIVANTQDVFDSAICIIRATTAFKIAVQTIQVSRDTH